MASTSDRRMLALLASAQGHLIYINKTRQLGPVIGDLIDSLVAHITRARENWPAEFSPKELKRLEDIMYEWGKHIDHSFVEADKLIVLFNVATQCISDVYFVTKNAHKKHLLMPMFGFIKELENKIDPLGNKFNEYEKAKELRSELYVLLGFTEDFV